MIEIIVGVGAIGAAIAASCVSQDTREIMQIALLTGIYTAVLFKVL